ncbi:hypothetical protein HYC85_012444 [Camellia sinensis]|uniref:HECT-type E3 ubiquitin transferase n=1 Tax=Camellia sinensis TaxID=4442 RepID=A0A7J7HE01_CAMSI|nr:hypothetical protein HYC85_012444 [Camellia sinensis]
MQPLYKGQLQRLLLNLCAHNETRTALVKILIDMLMLDIRRPVNHLSASEPSYRLYSRPQSFDGLPPLARNHPYVAKILLQFKLPQPLLQESENFDKARGKALMIVEEDVMEGKNHLEGYFSIVMLLSLLSQPLYLRSIAHLEQLLSLLDVIVDNAESKSSLSNESGIPAAEQTSGPHISTSVADINTVSSAISSGSDITASKPNDDSKPSASSTNAECDTQNVLDNLPQAELRLLCSLLAREGLSDNAYTMAAEVLKKLHILVVKVTYHDIEAIDPDYFKNLKWMLEVTDYELIPGGRNIRVTEENKHEYVDLVAEHLDDMRVNTEYSGYSAASPVIQWFWEVVQSFSKEDKARLLQFVTGTSKLDLPEYPSKQHLEERLLLAIHEANEGFGFG